MGRMMKPWVVMPRQTVIRYLGCKHESALKPKEMQIDEIVKRWRRKDTHQASLVSSARTDFMWRISPAMRKQTPMGARWTTHEVTWGGIICSLKKTLKSIFNINILFFCKKQNCFNKTFIMTWDTDRKKRRRGLPSSPEIEMAMPNRTSILILNFSLTFSQWYCP